jgi:hypothetical protein
MLHLHVCTNAGVSKLAVPLSLVITQHTSVDFSCPAAVLLPAAAAVAATAAGTSAKKVEEAQLLLGN